MFNQVEELEMNSNVQNFSFFLFWSVVLIGVMIPQQITDVVENLFC
jgi:hypothetical protein